MVSFGGQCFENAESETRWLTCQNIKQLGDAITVTSCWKSYLIKKRKCSELHGATRLTYQSMRFCYTITNNYLCISPKTPNFVRALLKLIYMRLCDSTVSQFLSLTTF
jgi:hypothetical protein